MDKPEDKNNEQMTVEEADAKNKADILNWKKEILAGQLAKFSKEQALEAESIMIEAGDDDTAINTGKALKKTELFTALEIAEVKSIIGMLSTIGGSLFTNSKLFQLIQNQQARVGGADAVAFLALKGVIELAGDDWGELRKKLLTLADDNSREVINTGKEYREITVLAKQSEENIEGTNRASKRKAKQAKNRSSKKEDKQASKD